MEMGKNKKKKNTKINIINPSWSLILLIKPITIYLFLSTDEKLKA